MTNLKKTLAVVLAFAMILSMGLTSMAAYSDVTAGTKVSEAVGILSNLGILTGFEDGTFKPEETVTRAQMAAIICRTLGYEDQAQSSMGTTVFNDVAADHWASGYINVAQAQQIINGYGDGNYGPEDLVTYEQAVKMIVSALGYDLAAQAKGGYPTGYLAIASAEGITKNANGKVGDAAARGTIAVLVYNSLEVRLMDQTSWSTGSDGDKYGKTDDTILSKYLEVQKWEGVVESVPVADYAQDGYKADTTPVFSLEAAGTNGSFYQEYWDGQLTKYYDNPVVDVDCSLVDVNEFAGKKVVAYVGEDEDAETGNRMVYAIAEKQGANTVTTISAVQLIDSTYNDFGVDGQISYKNIGSSRVYDLDLAADAVVSVNFGSLAAATDTESSATVLYDTDDLATLLPYGGTITFISNDNDAKIDVIRVIAYDAEAVIEAVENEDGVISFDTFAGSIDDVDTEEEDAIIVVYKDGAVATVADLAANDTVSMVTTFENGGDSFQLYYASSKTVTGMVESYSTDDEEVVIAGENYKVSALSSYSGNVASLSDKEGLFFLNVDGQIAHDEADAAKGKYGLVLAVSKTTGIKNGYEVQVALADGTVAEYALSSKAALNGGSKDDDATAIAIASRMGYTVTADAFGDAKYAKVNTATSLLFEVTVKNGEITKLKSLSGTSEKTGKEYDAENMSYSSLSFDDSTVVFALNPAYKDGDGNVLTTTIEDDDVTIGTIADFFTEGEGENYSLFGYDEDNDIYGAIIGYDLATTVPADSAAVIVTSKSVVSYDDDSAVKITGLQAGKEVSFIIYDEEADYTSLIDPEYLGKGDVIMVGVANAEGVVADFETLYTKNGVNLNPGTGEGQDSDYTDANEYAPGTIVATDDSTDDIYYVAGTLDETPVNEPTNSKFFLTSATGSHYVSADGIAMRDAANYTLVDYSEGSDPEISKKSKGKSIFGSLTKYNSTVFVRYYDDKLVEVVVYRTAA